MITACVAALAGCRSGNSAGDVMLALSDADPDVRRRAIISAAESNDRNAEWAVNAFCTIALHEADDPQTRCAAVRALRVVNDPQAADVLIAILNHESRPRREVHPPNTDVRWEAAGALVEWCAQGKLADDQRPAARSAFLVRLASDRAHRVRAEAARGLAYFPGDVSVLEALLAGLDDDKFVVVYECDHALEALTGVNQPAVARAWRQWYQANREKPFANAPAPSDATTQRPWYDIMNLFE